MRNRLRRRPFLLIPCARRFIASPSPKVTQSLAKHMTEEPRKKLLPRTTGHFEILSSTPESRIIKEVVIPNTVCMDRMTIAAQVLDNRKSGIAQLVLCGNKTEDAGLFRTAEALTPRERSPTQTLKSRRYPGHVCRSEQKCEIKHSPVRTSRENDRGPCRFGTDAPYEPRQPWPKLTPRERQPLSMIPPLFAQTLCPTPTQRRRG